MSTDYWVEQATGPVRFAEAIASLVTYVGGADIRLIELGPEATLAAAGEAGLGSVGPHCGRFTWQFVIAANDTPEAVGERLSDIVRWNRAEPRSVETVRDVLNSRKSLLGRS